MYLSSSFLDDYIFKHVFVSCAVWFSIYFSLCVTFWKDAFAMPTPALTLSRENVLVAFFTNDGLKNKIK